VASPLILLAAVVFSPVLALGLLALALMMVVRTARRCAWKAPGQTLLCLLYAVHVHAQKIPALWGQLAWRKAARAKTELALVDYKNDAEQNLRADAPHQPLSVKALLARVLQPLAWCQRQVLGRWVRVWSLARLQEAIGRPVDASNVILGSVELHGTCNISLGKNALIYPGVYLETQGAGSITLGDGVVLSSGVHIVAFEAVVLGDGCMVGEYSSIRDANHRLSAESVRHSGHDSAAIQIGRNVWLGRGVSVLMGASLGDHSVVAANAVVNKTVLAGQIVGGVPAKLLPRPSMHPSVQQPAGNMHLAFNTAV
jgi:acetyltransferase-like isoleucine patch superfamily enzyme